MAGLLGGISAAFERPAGWNLYINNLTGESGNEKNNEVEFMEKHGKQATLIKINREMQMITCFIEGQG